MRRRIAIAALALASLAPQTLRAADGKPESKPPVRLARGLDQSLVREALHAIELGVAWAEKNQADDGHWSNPMFPAMTGLTVSAISRSPAVLASGKAPESVRRGVKYILSKVQEDGGVYVHIPGVKGGGMPNYNTAICLAALADAGDLANKDVIAKGREFLIKKQHFGDDLFKGGMGYDASTSRSYADMSNTYIAIEALRRLEPPEKGDSRYHVDWKAAVAFMERCQHLKRINGASWVNERRDHGGFAYNPVSSKVGDVSLDDGVTTQLPAYGSITFAGAYSYVMAGMDPSAEQVQAALAWCARHWTLEENPRLGKQSLYYYFLAMARALDASGREVIQTPEGPVRWRASLIGKIVSLQKVDGPLGHWQNENNRWWESDPVLATAYALLALETALFGNV